MIEKPTPPPSQRFKEGCDPVPNAPCRDIIHFEFKSLHTMDRREDRYVELLIRVEKRFLWFRWRDVTFGPFGPFSLGLSRFNNRTIAELHFIDCLAHGKAYTRRGVK